MDRWNDDNNDQGKGKNEGEGRIGNWHIHWYINPLVTILGLFTEGLCDFSGAVTYFDLAYLTEFDPLWNNDILAFILNPEAILFGNIVVATFSLHPSIIVY